MTITMPDDKYNAYPDLKLAIQRARQARITLSAQPSPPNVATLQRANTAVRRLREHYAPAIREAKAALQAQADYEARYHSQLARKSRTLAPAAAQAAERRAKRALARSAALAKRAANIKA